MTEMMVELADLGDGARKDVGCGVLYGLLRDSAFKIRKVAEQEKEDHIRRGHVAGRKARSPLRAETSPGRVPAGREENLIRSLIRRSKCNPKTALKQR